MITVKTFVAKVSSPWGDIYPQAVVGILKVRTNNESSNLADSITGEVVVSEDVIIGGTFQAVYFNSGQTKDQNLPERPVLHMEDGILTDVFIIDIDDTQVQQILSGTMSNQEKRENIARVQLIKHFR